MKLSACCLLLSALLVPIAAQGQTSGRLDPQEQQTIDAQTAIPKLSPSATVATLDISAAPLKEAVDAIANAAGISVRYATGVTGLDSSVSARFSNATAEDALRTTLTPRGLTFQALSAKSVFVYADTPENRAKYAQSVKTFAVAKADLNRLMVTLNSALAGSADELRPTIVSAKLARIIVVRATPEVMTKVAKLIADNDK